MGWSNEQWIENHNALMQTDEVYAENCRREWAIEDEWCEWSMQMDEKQTDWFADYRTDHAGYEEIDEVITEYLDEDLPF